VSSARAALAFLTPIGGAAAPTPSAFGWFPALGAAIGAVLGLLWWAAARAFPSPVAAAIVVAADLGITGLLHIDGLLDSADGLLAPLDRDRRLAVMSEPSVGAFGVAVAGVVLVARFAALSALSPSIVLLTGIWCGSRAVMAVAPSCLPYARGDTGGLASAFLSGRRRAPALVAAGSGLAGLLVATMFWRPLGGAVAAASGVLAASAVLWLAHRRIGGFTGDVLGAAGVTFETVALVVAAAKW
jgi:adenosylcobinamide-GDP ribazoletransferase